MAKKFYKDCLNYPFQVDLIHKKKKLIKRELLERGTFIEKRIAILGGSTTSEIKDILELFLLKEGIQACFYESEFNKYYEDIIFKNPSLEDFKPDIIYIHTTEKNIQVSTRANNSVEGIERIVQEEIARFTSIWDSINRDYNCIIIQNNFELPRTRVLGNLDCWDIHGRSFLIQKLNSGFAQYAQAHQNFHINDIHYLSAWFGLEKWHDNRFWYSYSYAVSYDAIALLSHNIVKIIRAVYGKRNKCLVLDLDNTIWGGVIGDDGPDNIEIGEETAISKAYSAFQQYVKNLQDLGILLAVCTKNNFDIATEGFNHPDNILKHKDFVSFKANWDPKYVNIKGIAEEINIGLDSLVFIDDNPAERDLMRAQVPDVEVPEIGSEVIKYIEFIDMGGHFEPASLSQDDLQRNRFYEDNTQRNNLQATYADYGEFLESLEMVAEIKPFVPMYLERINQLINKTNQFNLTTKRHSFTEIKAVSQDRRNITLYGKLIDRFGDNGLISVIIGSIRENDLHIHIWVMSCRVIKRDMEFAMFDELVRTCVTHGVERITGYYYKTIKNEMVAEHYALMGFELVEEQEGKASIWKFEIPQNYYNKNETIKVNA